MSPKAFALAGRFFTAEQPEKPYTHNWNQDCQKKIAKASGDTGEIPELGRSSRGGNGNPLQYSCWDNLIDTGAS